MDLSELFSVDRIKVDLKSTSKVDVFHEMVNFLVASGALSDGDTVVNALLQRESVMSTLVAPNIALPHASMWLFKRTVGAFGISRNGIVYDSPSAKRVHVVMMLIDDRYDTDRHLALLILTAKLVSSPNFLGKILKCSKPEEVREHILELERLQRPK